MGGTRNRKPGSQKNGGDGDSADSKVTVTLYKCVNVVWVLVI